MPSFWTHFAFAKECRSRLPSGELAEAVKCHPHAYHTGMQGPDMFLFYLPTALRKKRISTELHTHSPEKLLTCLWKQAANAKGSDRSIALAYAVGFLGHYCLDSETHPFVYAHAGIERSARCHTAHNALEADLNALSVRRAFGKLPTELPFPDVYHLPKAEEAVIARQLSRAIGAVYGLSCSPATVSRALRAVRISCHLLCDRSGKKADFVRILEKPIGLPYLSPLFLGVSHYCADAANFAHRKWKDPYTGAVSDSDFFSLYDDARKHFEDALHCLAIRSPKDYPAFFRSICSRDFHGEPI